MTSTLTKCFILSFFVTNHVIVTTAVVTNNQFFLGSLIGASVLMPYVYGYNVLTPELIALLTAGFLLATIPTNQQQLQQTTPIGEPTCTTSGYKYDPSAGCFRVVKRIISTADAKQECIRDGGSLLLVNSEEEGDVLTKELQAQNLVGALVQGSRSNAADPWKDDNGNLLPYTGSGIISNNVNANTVMGYVQGNRFVATDPNSDVIGFICETPVTYI